MNQVAEPEPEPEVPSFEPEPEPFEQDTEEASFESPADEAPPIYEPSPIEASLDPWPSIAFAPAQPAQPQTVEPELIEPAVAETPTFDAPAAYEAPFYEAPAASYSTPETETSFAEPAAAAPAQVEAPPAQATPYEAFELEIAPTTINWPSPKEKKKDAPKKESKRRWGLSLPIGGDATSTPAPESVAPVAEIAPIAEVEPEPAASNEFSWESQSPLQGFEYNTPTFAMSLPSANDSRLQPAIGKRTIIAMCCAPLALLVLLVACVTFIGSEAKQQIASSTAPNATTNDTTATTLPGGWVNYVEPGGRFSAQMPSQPKASQVSSSDGPVSVWTSAGNNGHLSAVVVIGPLPKGADPKSQDPLNNAAKNAASAAGMSIKGQFVKTDDGITHLDALMTNAKSSTNVRFFVSGSTLVGLSINTDDLSNDPSAFNTLTRTFKTGGAAVVHSAETVATTAAPATTASTRSPIANWIAYKEPSGLFSVQMPVKPTVGNSTQNGNNETTWFSAGNNEAAEISLVKFPPALSGQITESALKQALATVASQAGMTVNTQSTSSANGGIRLNATLSNSDTKIQIKMIAQGANIYQLSYMAPNTMNNDTLNKTFNAFADTFKLGQSS